MTPHIQRMRGATLVTAIFLLVMLSVLGVAMVTLATGQQASSALDVQGARTYLAARAGAEWGVFQVTRAVGACSSATLAMPSDTSLKGISVTVLCSAVNDAATASTRYSVKATACNLASATSCPDASTSPDYVQRVVQIQFSMPGVP